MLRTPIAILLSGLLAASPVWPQTLTPAAVAAPGSALNDDSRAEAFYADILTRFGDARPFSNIFQAKRQPEAMLINLQETYGIAVPKKGFATGALEATAAPETLPEGCMIGVEAEIANRDPYNRNLLPALAAYPDMTLVMQHLRDPSKENHCLRFSAA